MQCTTGRTLITCQRPVPPVQARLKFIVKIAIIITITQETEQFKTKLSLLDVRNEMMKMFDHLKTRRNKSRITKERELWTLHKHVKFNRVRRK